MESLLREFVEAGAELSATFGNFPNKPTRLQENFLWQYVRHNPEYRRDYQELREIVKDLVREDQVELENIAAAYWFIRKMESPENPALTKRNGFRTRQVAKVNVERLLKDRPTESDAKYRQALRNYFSREKFTHLKLPPPCLVMVSHFFNTKAIAEEIKTIADDGSEKLKASFESISGMTLEEYRKRGAAGRNVVENLVIYHFVVNEGIKNYKELNSAMKDVGLPVAIAATQKIRAIETFQSMAKISPWCFFLPPLK